MNIGILGSGSMGTALAIRLLRAGHDVRLGSRNPERAARDDGHAISHCSYDEAVAHGEIVILAIGWPHGVEALQAIAGLNGKILLDVSNPKPKTDVTSCLATPYRAPKPLRRMRQVLSS
jgi:predicted dinucleotide-binding enzyme